MVRFSSVIAAWVMLGIAAAGRPKHGGDKHVKPRSPKHFGGECLLFFVPRDGQARFKVVQSLGISPLNITADTGIRLINLRRVPCRLSDAIDLRVTCILCCCML